MKQLFLILACTFGCVTWAGETLVTSQAEYREALKTLRAGDTIVLADGRWSDFEMVFSGQGTADKPITLTAQTKGKVLITGRSNLRLAGEHLVVSGLVFTDGYTPTREVIAFRRNNDQLAHHSRVTETVIDHFNNPERHEVDFWVMLYGKNNRFDHNHLVGKSNKGVTMAVRLNSEQSRENHHRIDHNYFGPRPILGSNGGETLRIGTSHYAHTNSLTVVENNIFDRCNGEVEIISSKSGGNVFRGNVFIESRGTLTLRHGDDNLVEGNVFFGNGVPHTGGIRVINQRQTIRNNYLEGLRGYRFGSALTVMNGVPNSPANRYVQVSEALIENNTIVDSDHIQLAAGSDAERSAVPINSRFARNLISHRDGRDPFTTFDDVSGIEFADNVMHKVDDPTIGRGIKHQAFKLKRAENGLLYPASRRLRAIGASDDLTPIGKHQVGVSWYPKPPADSVFEGGSTKAVPATEGALFAAVENAAAGDTLELGVGNYTVSKLLRITKPLTIRGVAAAGNASPQTRLLFERSALFQLAPGGSLRLQDLHISGQQAPDSAGNSLIRTDRDAGRANYHLIIERSAITDLDINHSFNVLSVTKHSFADQILIRDSVIRDVTGHVLALDREDDDLGIYNAEYVTVENARFENIGGSVASIYRGGTDESTFGPQLRMRGTTLSNVGHNKRNKTRSAMRLHGVQVTDVEQNELIGSRPVRVIHTVGEPQTRIEANQLTETPMAVITQHGAASECDCEGQ